MAAADDVTVEMRDGFAGVGAVVEHEPETVLGQPELLRDFRRLDQEMAEDLMIVGLRLGDPRDRLFRNDQDVDGRLRFDVMERNDLVVFVNNFRGDFPRDEFFEQGFAHGEENVRGFGEKVNGLETLDSMTNDE